MWFQVVFPSPGPETRTRYTFKALSQTFPNNQSNTLDQFFLLLLGVTVTTRYAARMADAAEKEYQEAIFPVVSTLSLLYPFSSS